MKKIIFLFIFLFLISGCSSELDVSDFDDSDLNIDNIDNEIENMDDIEGDGLEDIEGELDLI